MLRQELNMISDSIACGCVGVMPTDTIYGVVGKALDRSVVARIYDIKGRAPSKPFIVLISSLHDISRFDIELSDAQIEQLNSIWPGPVSVILPCNKQGLEYLHRGTNSLALRLPEPEWLRQLISQTGPIVATSANVSGSSTPTILNEIKTVLPGLDFYIEGRVSDKPSELARLESDGQLEWLVRC